MGKRCEVCAIDLVDDYAFQGHIMGKKHLKNMQQQQLKQNIEERSIFVTNLPSFANYQNLKGFFMQFGHVQALQCGPGYTLIQFTEREPVQFLLSRPIWMQNCKLNIRRRIFHDNKPKQNNDKAKDDNTEEADELSYENIQPIFDGQATFDHQVTLFLSKVQESDEVVEAQYGSVCASLDQLFKTTFSHCTVHRFGSTVTGLGFKKCDLDVFIDIGEPINEDEETATRYEWTPKEIFKAARKLMYRREKLFTKIVPIPRAKTPIIKFCHVPTNISCDISFKNSLGVHNSHLIKFYLSLDVRLKPLMVIIKYWARLNMITGMGRISNYTLLMMIIFYLQQPNVAIIPPVIDLQKSCDPLFVEGWQVNFNRNTTIHSTTNHSTIPELLLGFFEYYARFEYSTNVISPLDGVVHPRKAFADPASLPDSMHMYKTRIKNQEVWPLNIEKPMCVQDPIELTHNLTTTDSVRAIEAFQKHCAMAAECCSAAMKGDCRDLLPQLFTVKPNQEQGAGFNVVIRAGQFLRIGLPSDFDDRTDIVDKEQFVRDMWYDVILNLTKEFFTRVLKLEVKVEAPEREAKQQKCELQSDVHSKDEDKIILHCSGLYNMWHGRKGVKVLFNPNLSLLERESQVSELIVKELKKKDDSTTVIIDFSCVFEKRLNPTNVQLTFVDKKCIKNLFKEMKSYVMGKLPLIIDKTLLHMMQSKTKK